LGFAVVEAAWPAGAALFIAIYKCKFRATRKKSRSVAYFTLPGRQRVKNPNTFGTVVQVGVKSPDNAPARGCMFGKGMLSRHAR
jgi:hypothetical protein